MNTGLDIQNAMSMARSAPVQQPHAGKTLEGTKKAAKEFESVFISQFLGSMFDGVKTDGTFGGGQGEQMFRSLMLDQYGQKISEQGGFGLADSITRSLSEHQQAQDRARAAADAKAAGKDVPAAAPIPTQKQPQIFAAHPATLVAASLAASELTESAKK